MTETLLERMLRRERATLYHNIDRLQRGIEIDKRAGLRIAGQEKMLAIQLEHLRYLNEIADRAHDLTSAHDFCCVRLLAAQSANRKAAQLDVLNIHHPHGDEWWDSLRAIYFYSALAHRIEDWRSQNFEPPATTR